MSTLQQETIVSEDISTIENGLKDLLNKVIKNPDVQWNFLSFHFPQMLTYLENFIKSQDDLKEVEGKLNDYENLVNLVDMIKVIFDEIIKRVDKEMSKYSKLINPSPHPSVFL